MYIFKLYNCYGLQIRPVKKQLKQWVIVIVLAEVIQRKY